MPFDRAYYWINALILEGMGIGLGQVEAMSVAAMASAGVVYLQMKQD